MQCCKVRLISKLLEVKQYCLLSNIVRFSLNAVLHMDSLVCRKGREIHTCVHS